MKADFKKLLEVRKKDYSALFSTVEHKISCGKVPSASIRLHFIRHDAGGLIDVGKVVDTLMSYITQYCFAAEKRGELDEVARNRAFMAARKLFREDSNSGQPGELLVYFLIEAVLDAPQVLKKMLITTNPNDERKGSDGVHIRWSGSGDELEVIFAEAKLYKNFSSGLSSAFESMTDFHNSKAKSLEIDFFLNGYTLLSAKQQKVVRAHVEGESKGMCQEVHVCLIGYNWADYRCLKGSKKKQFLFEFENRYLAWAKETMKPALTAELKKFVHGHLRFEFFFLPFENVESFRELFLDRL